MNCVNNLFKHNSLKIARINWKFCKIVYTTDHALPNISEFILIEPRHILNHPAWAVHKFSCTTS